MVGIGGNPMECSFMQMVTTALVDQRTLFLKFGILCYARLKIIIIAYYNRYGTVKSRACKRLSMGDMIGSEQYVLLRRPCFF